MKNYYIKNNYEINGLNITNDEVSNDSYWDSNRIYAAEVYQFPVYKYLCKFINIHNINSVLDVGCGVAKKLAYLHKANPNVSIIGIDQEEPIKYCKNTYNFGSWYSDNIEKSSLGQNIKSDLVISVDVIEHLVNPDYLLDYIKQKLDVNGFVLISTPERDLLWGKECSYSPNKYHVREWNFQELEKYLISRGFEIVEHFLQFPVKISLNKIFYKEIILRALKLKPVKYNQVVVARLR